MSNPDLTKVPVEALVKELLERHPAGIILLLARDGKAIQWVNCPGPQGSKVALALLDDCTQRVHTSQKTVAAPVQPLTELHKNVPGTQGTGSNHRKWRNN